MDFRERRRFMDRDWRCADLGLCRAICDRRKRPSRSDREAISIYTSTGALGDMGGDCSRSVGRRTGDGKAPGLNNRTIETEWGVHE